MKEKILKKLKPAGITAVAVFIGVALGMTGTAFSIADYFGGDDIRAEICKDYKPE